MSNISQLAFVHPEAKLGKDVTVQPFAYIDRDVEIGDRCVIHPHVSILAGSRLGNDNEIYEGAIIAATPQDFRWKGDDSKVVIGNNNKIREYVIINRSIHKDGETRVGSDSFIMAQSHIGHDSSIGDHCVLGNGVKVAGDVKIGDCTILSSSALVHEGCEISEWVLVKGGCRINGNVPPFVIMAHNPVSYYGINAFILRKGKKSEKVIDDIAKCYRHLYQCNTSPINAVRRMREDIDPSAERDQIIAFVEGHNYRLAALPDLDTI